jgi:transcriptional regulator GlxA family with amidase domain
MAVARGLVVYIRRAGGQSQYSALLSTQTVSDDDQFSQLELWIAENLTQDLSIQALAQRTKMSPRNFARVYAAKRGRTPAKVVEAIRVDAARGLLEDTRLRIKAIALHCGFKNEEHMRTAFIRNIQLSPKEYRMRFSSH